MISVLIRASVGNKGKNAEGDVKTITALINIYRRSLKQSSIAISATNSAPLETAIGEFQSNYLKVKIPDKRVDAGGRTFLALKQYYRTAFKPKALTPPAFGRVTWDSEGGEGGMYHSRCFHVPSASSGLTIGRGYDMKEKSQHKIFNDLVGAGVSQVHAVVIQKASGLSGAEAGVFVIDNDLLDFQLEPSQQLVLFKSIYDWIAGDVRRVCNDPESVGNYGSVDWERLNPVIKDIVIDLRYRGDYTKNSRRIIQKSIADNDLSEFKKQLVNMANWPSVPRDRFNRRVKFLEGGK